VSLMARTSAREDPLGRAKDAQRDSKFVEFKERFDPRSDGEWIELIKDLAAIANSGGGVVVIGVKNGGAHSGEDVRPVLELDGATIADKVFRYVGEHFDGFEIHAIERRGRTVAAILIHPATAAPLVFQRPGQYDTGRGKTKTAFTRDEDAGLLVRPDIAAALRRVLPRAYADGANKRSLGAQDGNGCRWHPAAEDGEADRGCRARRTDRQWSASGDRAIRSVRGGGRRGWRGHNKAAEPAKESDITAPVEDRLATGLKARLALGMPLA
jgi:Putative DNA-binding domain